MANSVFVTVGSTRFDKLVETTSSLPFLQLLSSLGYNSITVQHGQSPIQVPNESKTSIKFNSFMYKSSLKEYMEDAELIISHAGSGSILEALRLKKKLIVVVNEDLMDNHQAELGSVLNDQGYLICCSPKGLEETVRAKRYNSLATFPDPDNTRFANFLDQRIDS